MWVGGWVGPVCVGEGGGGGEEGGNGGEKRRCVERGALCVCLCGVRVCMCEYVCVFLLFGWVGGESDSTG